MKMLKQKNREVLQVKMATKFLAAAFIGVLILGAALFVQPNAAYAADTGDEKVVAIIEYKCLLCNKDFFTFDPDDIDGALKGDFKMVNFQQANWIQFNGGRNPIRKCEKDPGGAHIMNRKRSFIVSPKEIYKYASTGSLLAMKSGGAAIKSKLIRWNCYICGRKGWCFQGDDMDQGAPVDFTKKMEVRKFSDNSQIAECKWKGFSGRSHIFHPLNFGDAGNPTSTKLLEEITNIYYSD